MIPHTTHQVGEQLAKLSRELDHAKEELNHADLDAVQAREAYKVAEAKATISADGGTVDVRKAQTVLATHDERLAAETADAITRGWQREFTVLRSRIDVGRTVGAGVRSETQLAPYGGGS